MAAALVAVGVAIVGCGTSDSDAAKKTASDFYTALRGGNGSKACSLLTPQEAQSAAGGSGGPGGSCSATIGQIAAGLPDAKVKSVKVSGNQATVVLTAAANLPITINLEKQSGKWRVAHFQ